MTSSLNQILQVYLKVFPSKRKGPLSNIDLPIVNLGNVCSDSRKGGK